MTGVLTASSWWVGAQRFWMLKSEPESRFRKTASGKTVYMKFGVGWRVES